MAGNGKYTNYAPKPPTIAPAGQRGASDDVLLKKLFAAPPEITDQSKVVAVGNDKLVPSVQGAGPTGNSDFPNGVYLNFQNPDPNLAAPEIAKIDPASFAAGGPSTPFTPNLSSPDPSGQGGTSPVPAVVLKVDEVKKGAVVGVDGTVDPKKSAATIYDGSLLGKSLKPGSRPGT